MSWSAQEEAEAKRCALALLRAAHDGREDDLAAILAPADSRELRAVIGVLAPLAADLTVRMTILAGMINGLPGGEQAARRALEDGPGDLVRGLVADNLAAAHAAIVADGP